MINVIQTITVKVFENVASLLLEKDFFSLRQILDDVLTGCRQKAFATEKSNAGKHHRAAYVAFAAIRQHMLMQKQKDQQIQNLHVPVQYIPGRFNFPGDVQWTLTATFKKNAWARVQKLKCRVNENDVNIDATMMATDEMLQLTVRKSIPLSFTITVKVFENVASLLLEKDFFSLRQILDDVLTGCRQKAFATEKSNAGKHHRAAYVAFAAIRQHMLMQKQKDQQIQNLHVPVQRCSMDTDCHFQKKCCPTYIGRRCLILPVTKAGSCPKIKVSGEQKRRQHRCYNDGHCPGEMKCCSLPLGKACLFPS
ncbi:hypothetical protein T07_1 [Trichinella nelsoni]|uniref:WAP domain-containing protein n=1 Tax=Trichinella nelsoni TaxID=6336 RepID=A0A0V0RL58_9BILA|nr:hypothetical protein T07_1 [Trichinella nelsoni]